MTFTNLLDVLGVKRFEDLFFKCRPEMIGVATNIKAIREKCERCQRPYIISWKYTIGDKTHTYDVSKICSACLKGQDSDSITKEFEEKRKKQLEKQWYMIDESDQSGFKNYEITNKATTTALETARDYTKKLLSNDNEFDMNLLLMGSTGTGKSHLAKAIARTLKEKGFNVAYVESVQLFEYIKGTFGNTKESERFMKQFINFDLVVIDDVGVETKKIGENSWTVTEWTKLVTARLDKATIYTTNHDDLSLPDVIGKRAFSRMYMNTKFIDLFTDDYRKKLQIS